MNAPPSPPLLCAEPVVVDARGHRCPVPSLRLRRALERAPPGGRVLLIADDPMARIDAPHLAAAIGARVLSVETDGAVLRILAEIG